MDDKKTCRSCKHWGGNREAILNGIENTNRSVISYCENEQVINSMNVWEVNLPDWIKTFIRKDFITQHTFGCLCWEEYIDWKKLWL